VERLSEEQIAEPHALAKDWAPPPVRSVASCLMRFRLKRALTLSRSF